MGNPQTGAQWYHNPPSAVRVLSPTSGFPAWSPAKGLGIPREPDFEGQRNLTAGLYRIGGKSLHSWRAHTKSSGPRGKEQGPHKRLKQTYLLVLEGLLRRHGLAVTHCGDGGTSSNSPGSCPLARTLLVVMRQDTIKLLERKSSDVNCSNAFFNPSPRIMEIKTKIDKYNLTKLKSFCTAKKTINKTKRQPSDWEKIFANDVTDKAVVSKIYKQFMKLNIIKTNNPLKKWAEHWGTCVFFSFGFLRIYT